MSDKRSGGRFGRAGGARTGSEPAGSEPVPPHQVGADDDWFVDPDITTDLGGVLGEAARDFDFGDGPEDPAGAGPAGGAGSRGSGSDAVDPAESTQRFTLPERPRGPKRRTPPSAPPGSATPADREAEREARRRQRNARRGGRKSAAGGAAAVPSGYVPAPPDAETAPRAGDYAQPPTQVQPALGTSAPARASRAPIDESYEDLLPTRPAGGGRRSAWQRVGMGVAALLVLAIVTAGAIRLLYSGRALPGTQIGALQVGGKSDEEIRAAVTQLTSPERRIAMAGGGQTIRATAGGAGLQPDVLATTDAALQAGRGWFLQPIGAIITGGPNVDLVATIDNTALRGTVARVAGELDRKPYAGALQISAETLTVETQASAAGREVERGELADRLQRELLAPSDRPVEIPIATSDAVSADRVAEVAEEAETYLQQPLLAEGAGKPYEVTPQALAQILQLEPLEGGEKAQLGVDADATALLAKRIAAARDRASRNASLSAPSTGPTVDGKAEVSWRPRKASVNVVSEARNGLQIDQAKLVGRIRNAVREGEHKVAVPAKVTKPAVTAAQADKVTQLIGTFTTYYEAGQPRVTNIQRIARSVDRTLIGPGQQFSLNGISGERTKAKGYVEAPFIAENRIEPSIGGGVSQFSTTMYNAAYFAGLQIDAFRPHSLFIDRYPAGRESTLNYPDIDMKWTNDTGAPVLIRTSADDARVTVTLYGNNGGRRVKATPGDRQPNPGGNFKITITRTIRYSDGRVVTQPTTTSYANENKTPVEAPAVAPTTPGQ